MQKYKLVYEVEKEEQIICLIGTDDSYSNEVEICYIDKFTTVFKHEQECIKYLYDKKIIINPNGTLHIKRPKGKVDVEKILYDDEAFRNLSCRLISQLKNGKRTRIPQISELFACVGPTIRFFSENDYALKLLNKEYNFKTSFNEFVTNLNGYLKFKDQSSFTPEEIAEREKYRNKMYKLAENYDLVRDLKIWISEYKKGKKSEIRNSNWKNPYEIYDKKTDDEDENKQK